MLGTETPRIDGKRAPHDRLGLGLAMRGDEQAGQKVDIAGDVGMLFLVVTFALGQMKRNDSVEAQIVALEKRAFEAWKNKDRAFFEDHMSEAGQYLDLRRRSRILYWAIRAMPQPTVAAFL